MTGGRRALAPIGALASMGMLLLLACRGPAAPTSTSTPAEAPLDARARPVPAPASDRGDLCADVGSLRVCWEGNQVVNVEPSPVPAPPPSGTSPMGRRCAGQGATRTCVDRAAGAPLFSCAGTSCTQRHARMPDDGEWTCAEMAGVVVCAGGEPPAGVVASPADPAWLCGARRGSRSPRDRDGPRVCVDLSPDFPDGIMTGWRCRALNELPGARVCQRDAGAATLTAACDRAHPCVDGALCVSQRCVPARPAPSCWLDADCAGGACRFGTCVVEARP